MKLIEIAPANFSLRAARALGVAVLGVALGVASCGTPAYALGDPTLSDITWVLHSGSGNSQTSETGAGAFGNIRTFTSAGKNLKAAAYSMSSSIGSLTTGYLGQFGAGLGVCDQSEGLGCGSSAPNYDHTGDNHGQIDMVIFEFGQDNYDPLQLNLTQWLQNTNFDYYVGGTLAGFDSGNVNTPYAGFAGKTLAQITAIGAWSAKHDSNGTGNRNVDLSPDFPSGELGRYLIIVADADGQTSTNHNCGTGYHDYTCTGFKIDTLIGEVPTQTPEPTTLTLFGAALAGLGFVRRRRKA